MIYVTNSSDDTVSVVDGNIDSVTSVVSVGRSSALDINKPGSGVGVSVNSITNMIYVSNQVDDTLSVIDGAVNSVIATISTIGNSLDYFSIEEWQEVDNQIKMFSLKEDDSNRLYNFWEATEGRASITMDKIFDSLKLLVANFSANIRTGKAPLMIEFKDLSTKLPNTWLWDFGDGVTSNEKNPSHIYTIPGFATPFLLYTRILYIQGHEKITCV